jgi:hypothetical protein
MKTTMIITGAIAFLAIGMIFGSCKKEETSPSTPTNPTSTTDKASKAATENASAEAAFSDAFRQVDKAAKQNQRDMNSCPTITFTPADFTTYPKDLVIDFGTSCTGTDGAIRSGKILAHLTKCYIDSGSVTTITFDNYYVNSHLITGTETITNEGRNTAGHQVFAVQVVNGNYYSPDGVTTYNSTQEREWIEGEGTLLDPMDDVYMITGNANGTTTDGTTYTAIITSALRVAVGCAWIESGILEINETNIPVITLDYGTGDCDNIATATCYGYTFTIYM